MGREIEIKIPLLEEQFSFLCDFAEGRAEISGVKAGSVQKILKKDEYFSRFKTREERLAAKEPQVIRIRTEEYDIDDKKSCKPKSFFCIKRKSVENGIELNREDETFVEDISVVRDILKLGGFKRWFKKEKKAVSVHCEYGSLPGIDFHLEVEEVNSLKYAEIEVCDGNQSADVVRKALENFVEILGLNPKNRDSRSWVQIINGE